MRSFWTRPKRIDSEIVEKKGKWDLGLPEYRVSLAPFRDDTYPAVQCKSRTSDVRFKWSAELKVYDFTNDHWWC